MKGPHIQKRADACWTVICNDGRPHRNRHSHRTDLEEARIPKVLINERIGHVDTSVQANYTHITDTMRDQLAELLTSMWFEAVDARLAMCPLHRSLSLMDCCRLGAQEYATSVNV